jgi:hypothetical protein
MSERPRPRERVDSLLGRRRQNQTAGEHALKDLSRGLFLEGSPWQSPQDVLNVRSMRNRCPRRRYCVALPHSPLFFVERPPRVVARDPRCPRQADSGIPRESQQALPERRSPWPSLSQSHTSYVRTVFTTSPAARPRQEKPSPLNRFIFETPVAVGRIARHIAENPAGRLRVLSRTSPSYAAGFRVSPCVITSRCAPGKNRPYHLTAARSHGHW